MSKLHVDVFYNNCLVMRMYVLGSYGEPPKILNRIKEALKDGKYGIALLLSEFPEEREVLMCILTLLGGYKIKTSHGHWNSKHGYWFNVEME